MDSSRVDTQLTEWLEGPVSERVQGDISTEWVEGDISTQLVVDLEKASIGRKRDLESTYPPDDDLQDIPTEDESEPEPGAKKRRQPGKQKTRPPGPGRPKIINGNTFFVRYTLTDIYIQVLNDATPNDLRDDEEDLREHNRQDDLNQEEQEEFVRRWSHRIADQEKNKPPPIVRWQHRPITQRCMDVAEHKGLGCASVSANHIPAVYHSLRPVIFLFLFIIGDNTSFY